MADVRTGVFKAISILMIFCIAISKVYSVEYLGMSYQEQNCIWFQPILTIGDRVTWKDPRNNLQGYFSQWP